MISLRVIYGLALALLVIALVISFIFLSHTNQALVIHFDKYNGINLWGDRADAIEVIIFGFILNALNIGLAFRFHRRQVFSVLPDAEKNEPQPADSGKTIINNRKLLPYLFGFFNIFISVLILIAVGVIISVN